MYHGYCTRARGPAALGRGPGARLPVLARTRTLLWGVHPLAVGHPL